MSDSESSGSSEPCKLPCSKTLRAWATSRFEQWLRSDSLEWQQQKTRFSSQQIVAWFAFKDKKFQETVKSLQATGAESTIDRTLFGCCKKYHRDTEFISIFKTPNVKRTVKKNKRYINELRLILLNFRSDRSFRISFSRKSFSRKLSAVPGCAGRKAHPDASTTKRWAADYFDDWQAPPQLLY
jgi:hypothetical protein